VNLAEIWAPLPTQQAFLDTIAASPDMGMAAYVGGYGSGKTWALCRAVIGLAFADQGSRILVGRQFSTDLRDTTQAQFFEMMDELEAKVRAEYTGLGMKGVLGEFAASRNEYVFHNGSLVMFRPLDEAEKKYKSLNASAFAVDEGSEVSITAMLLLKSRIRKAGHRRVGFVVSNPTSTRHWLYEWFVRDPKEGQPLPDHKFFRAPTQENAANLPPNYVETLKAAYPEDWVRLYLMGEWGELRTGQRPVFPTFETKLHVGATEWFRKKPVFVGVDWGWKNPGVVWAQINDKQQLMVHRCWFPRELHTYALGEGIKKRNDEWFPGGDFYYFGGWDGTKHHDSAEKTSKEIFDELGLPIKLVYAHIDRGLNIMRNLLDLRDGGTTGLLVNPVNERMIEGFLGGYHYPPIKGVVLSSQEMSPTKEEPAEDGLYDQLMDALRYLVVSIFDTSTASSRAAVVYGYRKGTKKPLRPYRSSLPHRERTVIGLGYRA
jgi:PBSX family phage terminase large subunit